MGSVLQSFTGSWHTEQTNFSPSANAPEGADTAISVSTVLNFLTVAGFDFLFDVRAMVTRTFLLERDWKRGFI
jgi:hypothetical protein